MLRYLSERCTNCLDPIEVVMMTVQRDSVVIFYLVINFWSTYEGTKSNEVLLFPII